MPAGRRLKSLRWEQLLLLLVQLLAKLHLRQTPTELELALNGLGSLRLIRFWQSAFAVGFFGRHRCHKLELDISTSSLLRLIVLGGN